MVSEVRTVVDLGEERASRWDICAFFLFYFERKSREKAPKLKSPHPLHKIFVFFCGVLSVRLYGLAWTGRRGYVDSDAGEIGIIYSRGLYGEKQKSGKTPQQRFVIEIKICTLQWCNTTI